jgi:hypothetical protein
VDALTGPDTYRSALGLYPVRRKDLGIIIVNESLMLFTGGPTELQPTSLENAM